MDSNFLEEFLSIGSGPKPFNEWTWDDEVAHCGVAYSGMKSTPGGGIVQNAYYRCHHYKDGPNGEKACENCRKIHDWQKQTRIEDAISEAFENNPVLYLTRTIDAKETKRLSNRARKKGGRYMSIPCNADGGKIFILNIPDDISGACATTKENAIECFMPFRDKSEWGYMSGNLYKATTKPDDYIKYTIPDGLNVTIEEELRLGIEAEATLTIGIEQITRENAAIAVVRRLRLIESIARECGFPNAAYTKESEVTVSLEKLQESWHSAQMKLSTKSSLKNYPPSLIWKLNTVKENGLKDLKKFNRQYMKDRIPDVHGDPFRDMGIWK